MAFAGFHVAFVYLSGKGRVEGNGLVAKVVSAETMAVAGTSTVQAPGESKLGPPAVVLRASADSWYTIGPSPSDPTSASSPRDLILAGERIERFVEAGDKVRWALA